jgi:bacterioferritin
MWHPPEAALWRWQWHLTRRFSLTTTGKFGRSPEVSGRFDAPLGCGVSCPSFISTQPSEKENSMTGDKQAIGHLQAQLKNELTAINQYFVHYRMLKHWGFEKLAKKEYAESIGEMKHADLLMDRIFMLDGLPNLQDLGKINIGEDVPEILASDLALERGAQSTIKDGIAYTESVRDYVSRDLLLKILDDTEEHVDFLETQIELIAKVGLQNYQQSIMGEIG